MKNENESRENQLALARQTAIDVLLRLMGCTDAKQSNCEHVAAIGALVQATAESTAYLFGYDGPIITQVAIRPGVTGHREGRL